MISKQEYQEKLNKNAENPTIWSAWRLANESLNKTEKGFKDQIAAAVLGGIVGALLGSWSGHPLAGLVIGIAASQVILRSAITAQIHRNATKFHQEHYAAS